MGFGDLDRRSAIARGGIAAVVVAVGAGVALFAGGSGGTERAGAQGVPPALGGQLEVFRRASTSRDELPGNPARDLRMSGDAQPGEDPTLSRRIVVPGGPTVYLWPTGSGVCASWGNCVPAGFLRKMGVALSVEQRGASAMEFRVAGIARDGIEEVRFRLSGGREVTAPVHNNVVWLPLGGSRPVDARWQNPDGTTGSHPVLLPSADVG